MHVVRRQRRLQHRILQQFLAQRPVRGRGTLAGLLYQLIGMHAAELGAERNGHGFRQQLAARDVADASIAQGFDQSIDEKLRAFFYLPFMHSEDLEDQLYCVELCRALGNEDNLKYAEIHADVIRRFGRFPHRNDVLGRETTPEEQAFLDSGGFAG